MTMLVGTVDWGAAMHETDLRSMFVFCCITWIGCACAGFFAGTRYGQHIALRNAAAQVLGPENSRFADAAAIAVDQIIKLGTAAEKAALKDGISQCRVAVDQAVRALDTCNEKLGVLTAAHDQALAQAKAKEQAQRKMMVRYESTLGDACADWANQPICPALIGPTR